MFPSISPKQSFPALESEILAYWKANNTFQKSVDSRPEDNPYRFYDGPPFITGTPHYGSLLSSIVKDVVGRYWTMRGRRVDRVWGWDCHGLPIEEKVQKKLGLKSNKEIEERGVKEFIDGCYEYTQSTSAEWDWYIDKIGRWVDMDRAYRTMDQDYMESVMWVFSELWKKGLIYEGKRVSLYSWKLSTPISNFEVAMDDTYQEVNDPAITVKFRPEMIKACGIIVENNKGEVLLGHNKKGFWSFPGGKGEAGETHAECATRELLEETGITYEITEKDGIDMEQYDIIKGRVFDNHMFRINIGDTPVGNGEPEIFHEWKYFAYDALPENIFEPTAHAIDILAQGKTQKNLPLSILAWTTTPWTIPANMALAVRNDIDYLLVENNGEGYIVAKNRVENVFKGKGEYTVIREFKGSELVGLSYVPPFPEYYHGKHGDKNHRVYHADFITDTDGTGIGHEAPEFGDVDFQLAKREGIYISEAMDEAGKYTSQIFDYEGTHYLNLEEPEKGANKINIERMKANNTLFKLEGITHRVPFCPRSGTPLMQKAQSSWFIDIQSQKEKLLKANEQINWFPEHLKFGRFAKGIESAPDWCISRTRFWGAPMPVWIGEDGEKIVVSSRDEIFEMNKPYGQLTKLIITRHAESEANVERHYDDVGLSPLSPTGRGQANSLMQELKDTGVDIIITSPFVRAIETAEPLAKALGIEIITDERLKETDHGKFANANYNDESTRKLVHEQRDRIFADKSVKFGETGESYTDVESRVKEVIEEICEKYPGKTVFVVSHGFPIRIITEYLTGKRASEKTHNADTRTFILDIANRNLLNLHKPYIDAILLQNPKAKKAKKVLGIHGWMSVGKDEIWEYMNEKLNSSNLSILIPEFPNERETSYAHWKEKINTLNIANFDTLVAHSFGCPVVMQYIIENQIHIDRLVLIAPSGLVGNEYLEKVIPEMTMDESELKKYVREIVVIHSKDDASESGKFEYGKNLAEKIGAQFVGVNGYNHDFRNNGKTIVAGLVQYGRSMTRIPEVLDVWMDSGSMPYAQVHFPFAGFEDTNIKKAETNEEKTECFAFFENMWKEEFNMDFHNRQNITYDWIKEDFWNSTVFYLSEGEKIISTIQLSTQSRENQYTPIGSAVLGRIGTLKEYRGNGNGTKLIKKALSFLSKHGNKEVYLNAEIKNIDFYKSFGFIQIQENPEEKGNTEAVYMKKNLSKADELQSLVFPADFIAEYVGQVRAWFYVMHVLGVLLNPNKEPTPTPSFTNVITTGVINGNDGRKMSKSFQNYPDPRMAIEKYGADPIRFYMLNSPLLSGGDMDFKEEGIVETIKGVMLPIWNTYSFFTTYANIDKWEKDPTDIWIVRHGETTTNASKAVNGGSMDTPLTEKGQTQSSERGKFFSEHGIGFDVIITTPKMRTKQTAEHIAKEIGFTGVWDEFDEFTEQDMGEFEGRNHDELREEWIQKHGNDIGWTRIYRENTKESFENFIVRVEIGMKKLREKYSGKRVLIVAHGGTGRAIGKISLGYTYEEAIVSFPPLKNGEAMHINNTAICNPLDRWIISKLQVLIGQVHDAMDAYDVSRACRAIVDYMDELTNWYVRLSRRRFWGSEMTGDKASGYETLYTVLTEISKLLAPYMPFLAESIYKGLTGRESVHLEYITEPSRHLIASELNRDMEICEHIVSLGLALRSRKNIRVRQPLSSVTITRELDSYYQTIIRDELNVKEVRFENPEKLAKKICKPDARKIGPKYGKDVQKVIMEAKNGNFIEKENGIIDVGGFVLESGEYVMEYLPLEGTLDVEGGYGMVVGLDTSITEELKLEGYARDIIRLIQDMRKEGDYQVTDRIEFSLTGPGTEKILELFGTYICHETLSVIKEKLSNPEVSKTEEIDNGITISLEVRRI